MRLFAVDQGLHSVVTDVCLWSVSSAVLHRRTLDFYLLLRLFGRLRKAVAGGKLAEEQLDDIFWTASESFLDSTVSIIRHVRDQPDIIMVSLTYEALPPIDFTQYD